MKDEKLEEILHDLLEEELYEDACIVRDENLRRKMLKPWCAWNCRNGGHFCPTSERYEYQCLVDSNCEFFDSQEEAISWLRNARSSQEYLRGICVHQT